MEERATTLNAMLTHPNLLQYMCASNMFSINAAWEHDSGLRKPINTSSSSTQRTGPLNNTRDSEVRILGTVR